MGNKSQFSVPTTLLASQHMQTFSERFANYPVRVEMLSRFLTPAESRAVADGLASGSVDIVIGTHKLLAQDVKFKDLGLLVVDEEQRFGVTHKETIKKLSTDVDVLTMTASPIPRTLEMSLTGVSILAYRYPSICPPAHPHVRGRVRRAGGGGGHPPGTPARRPGFLRARPRP